MYEFLLISFIFFFYCAYVVKGFIKIYIWSTFPYLFVPNNDIPTYAKKIYDINDDS